MTQTMVTCCHCQYILGYFLFTCNGISIVQVMHQSADEIIWIIQFIELELKVNHLIDAFLFTANFILKYRISIQWYYFGLYIFLECQVLKYMILVFASIWCLFIFKQRIVCIGSHKWCLHVCKIWNNYHVWKAEACSMSGIFHVNLNFSDPSDS